ncbi:MAG: hypothetical protein WBA57_14105 [Elainellaceae cyanobacterium]
MNQSVAALDSDYLIRKANEVDLTAEQKEVFLLKFKELKTNKEIASKLNISQNACIQCMGEIYKKFNIQGKSKGKERQLLNYLLRQDRQEQGLAGETFTGRYRQDPIQRIRSWIVNLLGHSQETGSSKGNVLRKSTDATDDLLGVLYKELPSAITLISNLTSHTSQEIALKIFEEVREVIEACYPEIWPNQVPELRFIVDREQNPLARSIVAFVYRTLVQFGIDPKESLQPWEVLGKAMELAQERKPSPSVKVHSAWFRAICMEVILKARPSIETQASLQFFPIDSSTIYRHLLAVDISLLNLCIVSNSILSMEREASVALSGNFTLINFYDILRKRWFLDFPWGNAVNRLLKEDERKEIELKALLALRHEYHKLDNYGLADLESKYERLLKNSEDIKDCGLLTATKKPKDINWCRYSDDWYPVSGIPDHFVSEEAENLSKLIWEYSRLASINLQDVSQTQVNRLQEIVNLSEDKPVLAFWVNEVDHFMVHLLNFREGDLFTYEQSQKDQLRLAVMQVYSKIKD